MIASSRKRADATTRCRVLLTDGERTVDFVWLRHVAGKQVVCGIPEDKRWHMTYPADGRAHYTLGRGSLWGPRRRYLRSTPVPLRGFKGQRELLALGLTAATLEDTGTHLFKGCPQEAVAFLDLRAFRQDATVWTALGIVEARKTDQLRFDFEVQQLLLVTRLNPWVYVAAGVREAETQ